MGTRSIRKVHCAFLIVYWRYQNNLDISTMLNKVLNVQKSDTIPIAIGMIVAICLLHKNHFFISLTIKGQSLFDI